MQKITQPAELQTPSYALTAEKVAEITSARDLATYDGWTDAAFELLKNAPDWTAIHQPEQSGFIVKLTYHGLPGIYACAQHRDPATPYTESDLVDFDNSAWAIEAWDGMTAEDNARTLTSPIFVALTHGDE